MRCQSRFTKIKCNVLKSRALLTYDSYWSVKDDSATSLSRHSVRSWISEVFPTKRRLIWQSRLLSFRVDQRTEHPLVILLISGFSRCPYYENNQESMSRTRVRYHAIWDERRTRTWKDCPARNLLCVIFQWKRQAMRRYVPRSHEQIDVRLWHTKIDRYSSHVNI